jgi:hypothetical protein|nr:MAG TPA: baseplate wedge protein [Caudoviricetes sp.]
MFERFFKMSLLNDTFDDSGYGHEDFKTVIEDHLPILSRADNIDQIINVAPIDAARWEYDFSGLLRFLGVQPQYHWATMRVNGLRSADEYRSDLIQIKIPSKEVIDRLYNYYNTVIRKSAG